MDVFWMLMDSNIFSFFTQMDVLRQEIFLQKLATGMEKALKSPRFLFLLLLSLMFATFWSLAFAFKYFELKEP